MLSQDEGKNKDEAKMSRYKKGKIVSLLPQNLFKLGIHLYEEEEENEMQNRKFVVRHDTLTPGTFGFHFQK